MRLYENGVYLIHGNELIEDIPGADSAIRAKAGKTVSREEAAKNTIAYGILKAHNTSGNMDKLKIRFDKLTSHDITFVGIIQTARASGLERFPVPYVLTNCHNSLCAVGGTIICLDLPVPSGTAGSMFRLIRRSSTSMRGRCWRKGEP